MAAVRDGRVKSGAWRNTLACGEKTVLSVVMVMVVVIRMVVICDMENNEYSKIFFLLIIISSHLHTVCVKPALKNYGICSQYNIKHR